MPWKGQGHQLSSLFPPGFSGRESEDGTLSIGALDHCFQQVIKQEPPHGERLAAKKQPLPQAWPHGASWKGCPQTYTTCGLSLAPGVWLHLNLSLTLKDHRAFASNFHDPQSCGPTTAQYQLLGAHFLPKATELLPESSACVAMDQKRSKTATTPAESELGSIIGTVI